MLTGLAQSVEAQALTPAEPSMIREVIAPYMGVFFVAFFVSIIATPIMRMLAVRNGIVDLPDLKRKNHLEPVAYLGGVAIFLGWLMAVGLAYLIVPSEGFYDLYGTNPLRLVQDNPLVSIMLGAGAITLTGFFDDVYHISPRVKVGGQLFAAAALANNNVGTQLIDLTFSIVGIEPVGWLSYVLGTALIAAMVLGGCNAMNLIDGLDGVGFRRDIDRRDRVPVYRCVRDAAQRIPVAERPGADRDLHRDDRGGARFPAVQLQPGEHLYG